ncbi:hypothetical protein AA19596_0483 [Acetobacter fabarum DSM 19596]|nr:hypothetical protein AA19596_0483 [Acetobacter fabarum DSM 19596]
MHIHLHIGGQSFPPKGELHTGKQFVAKGCIVATQRQQHSNLVAGGLRGWRAHRTHTRCSGLVGTSGKDQPCYAKGSHSGLAQCPVCRQTLTGKP